MKLKNFLRIAIFLMGFLVLNHFMSRGFVHWSRYGSEYAIAQREFAAMQDQVWLVFLGDSHPQKGAKAGDIPGAYTLAASSETYPHTYYIMKYYLEEKGFQPEVAVVEIDPIGFIGSQIDVLSRRDPAYWDQYVNYLAVGAQTEEAGDLLPTYFKAKFPLLGSWDVVLDRVWPIQNLPPEPLEFGFVPLERDMVSLTDEKFERSGFQRAEKHFSEGDYPNETMVTYFLKLIDLLQAHDVQVVLAWYPMTKPYNDAMELYLSGEEHINTLEELLGERQVDLILDYHDAYYGQREYFADSDHLNVWGAELLTQSILDELIEAGLTPPSVGD